MGPTAATCAGRPEPRWSRLLARVEVSGNVRALGFVDERGEFTDAPSERFRAVDDVPAP